MQSNEIDQLAKALAAAQSSISPASKDAVNPHFRAQYATLQSVWNAAHEVLAPNGLSVVQTFEQTDGARLDLTTTLLHVSGQWIKGTISLTPTKADPQGCGSAATYARRYSLAAILGIVADDDDDGEAASRPHVEKPAQPVSRPVSPAPKPAAPAPKPVEVPRDPSPALSWRSVVVPPFIKKYAGQTLEYMDQKDLLWWAEHYEPKPYKGSVQQKDLDFQASLREARDEILAKRQPAPMMPDEQKYNETEKQEDVPFN